MWQLVQISVLFSVISAVTANYNGPYLFWGLPRLESLENSALNGLDEEILKDIYSEASAIMIFVKNSTHTMTSQHYPSLEGLLADRESAYMPQSVLIYDPVDLNMHTEVIALSGTPEQEDIELCALFRDAEINYGEKKVLGILANSLPDTLQRQRREVEVTTTSTETPISTTTLESAGYDMDGRVKGVKGKALFYNGVPPEIQYADSAPIVLKETPQPMTVDTRETWMRLGLKYSSDEKGKDPIQCYFRVELSGGYWTLVNVDVLHGGRQMALPVIGTYPSAPLMPAYSYRCSYPLVFGNENVTLTLRDFQVHENESAAASSNCK